VIDDRLNRLGWHVEVEPDDHCVIQVSQARFPFPCVSG
jgi:hypothetical protein